MLKRNPLWLLLIMGTLGLATQVLAQDPSASIRHTPTPIVIDGVADDAAWATANENEDFFVAGGTEPTDEVDLSAKWRALWDEDNLYFWIEVQDADLFTEDTRDWQDDSVELYIDTESLGKGDDPITDYRPSVGGNFGPLDPAEAIDADPPIYPIYQLTIHGGQDKIFNGINHRTWINQLEGSEFDDMEQAPHLGVTTLGDAGYVLEIALPWKSLGSSEPTDILDRGSFGFGVAINDNDVGGARETQVMWATSDGDLWNNPQQFPDVALLFPEGSGPDIFVKRELDLGQLTTDVQQLTIPISNVGTDNALTISDVTVSGPDADRIAITGFPATVPPGGNGLVQYTLTPGRTGAFQFTFTINSDDVDAEDQAREVAITAASINPAGPWGHYTMNEAADAAEMFDVTGRGNHGIFNGPTLAVNALASGTSAAFSGGSQGEIPGTSLPLTNFSVSMWINQSSNGGLQTLFGQGSGTPNFAVLVNEGELSWFAEDAIEFSSGSLASETTYHVAATYDASGASPTSVLYLDGVEVARQEDAAAVEVDDDPYYIGAFATALGFEGSIDDVQVYNRVLAADTIKELFDTPGSVPGEIVNGGAFAELWVLGDTENGNQSEFSQERGADEAPGSVTAQDDDFYFWGVYPDPIGTVTDHEATSNFDRAHTPGDTFNRIHFNLDADSAAADTELRLTVAFCCYGAGEGGPSEHDMVMRFNGNEFFSQAAMDADTVVEQVVTAGDVSAVVGANTIEIERTGGSESAWIQYDYLRLEASAGAPVARPSGDGGGGPVEPGELPEGAYPLATANTGPGLKGYFWRLEPKEFLTEGQPQHKAGDGGADNTNAGWADENVYNQLNTGEFVASSFTYEGNDLTPISEWLGDDGASFSGGESTLEGGNNLDDGAFRMVGFIQVDAPGNHTFTTTSDDGSVVYVNNELVISNDNGHGNETVSGTVNFPAAGYYPIDIRYFNGDWTNDGGEHGGANFIGEEGFENVVQGLVGVADTYTPPSNDPRGDLGAVANSSGPLTAPTLVNYGNLSGDATYEFSFKAVKAGASTAIAGNEAWALKLEQWSETGFFGTTEFGVVDNTSEAPAVFDADVHVAFVSDTAAGETRIYINGALAGSTPGNPAISGEGAIMGARDGTTDPFGEGSVMHGWASYNTALSEADVLALSTTPFPGGNDGGLVDPGNAPDISSVNFTGDGLSLSLPEGAFDIEFSTDLENWSVIASDVTGTYTDDDAARIGGAEGYYRAAVK